jgi:hypothetical protein
MLPVQLDDKELRDCAMACRAAAAQAQRASEQSRNRLTSAKYAGDAERYTQLAERFEKAQRQAVPLPD